jgi:hypothetical protein
MTHSGDGRHPQRPYSPVPHSLIFPAAALIAATYCSWISVDPGTQNETEGALPGSRLPALVETASCRL